MTKKTALIVDDSRSACVVLSRMLARYGLISEYKTSGSDALEYLKYYQPSVIFMDHAMPDMDGLQVVEEIKKNKSLSNVPILMFTARSDDDYLERALEVGAVGVLPKILDTDVLKKALLASGVMEVGVNRTAPVDNKEDNPEPSSEEKMRVWLESVIENKIAPSLSYRIDEAIQEMREETRSRSQKLYRDYTHLQRTHHDDLLRNLDAQNDYLLAAYQSGQTQTSKRVAVSVALVALVVFFLGVQGWQEISDLRMQMAEFSVEPLKEELDVFSEEIISKIDNEADNNRRESKSGYKERLASAESYTQKITPIPFSRMRTRENIVNNEGRLIGRSLGFDANGEWLNVISLTNYRFQIDNRGLVRSFNGIQFFQSFDCTGESWVTAHKGLVFRKDNNELVFTSNLDGPTLIKSESMLMMDGTCEAYSGNEYQYMVRLLDNDNTQTGLESIIYYIGSGERDSIR